MMAAENENFLARWSRVKREAAAEAAATPAPVVPVAEVTEPALPPVEQLNFESDFTAFMRSKVVEEGVKRAALKKLFSDPRFNIQDGLDIYIDDYTKEDPIPPELLEQLQHAKRTLFGPEPDPKAETPETAADPAVSEQPQAQAEIPSVEEPKAHGDRG